MYIPANSRTFQDLWKCYFLQVRYWLFTTPVRLTWVSFLSLQTVFTMLPVGSWNSRDSWDSAVLWRSGPNTHHEEGRGRDEARPLGLSGELASELLHKFHAYKLNLLKHRNNKNDRVAVDIHFTEGKNKAGPGFSRL